MEARGVIVANNRLALFMSDISLLRHMESIVGDLREAARQQALAWLKNESTYDGQLTAPDSERLLLQMDPDRLYAEHFKIDRMLMSFLSFSRSAKDFWLRCVLDRYTDHSPQFRALRRVIRQATQGSFAFSFLHELRNYAQHHRGIGLTASWSSPWIAESRPPAMDDYADLVIDRDFLLSEAFDWKRVKPCIERQSAKISLLPLMTDLLSRYWVVQEFVLSLDIGELRRAARIILNTAKSVDGLESGISIIRDFSGIEDIPDMSERQRPAWFAEMLISGVQLHVPIAKTVQDNYAVMRPFIPSHSRR